MTLREFGPIPWDDWSPDPAVETWTRFLIEVIGPDEWKRRRDDVEAHIRTTTDSTILTDLHSRQWVPSDSAGWHLLICENFVRSPTEYPLAQGARHIPIVKSLMRDWPLLLEIENLEGRLRHGFMNEREHFDAALFEVLVAMAYLRAGHGSVELVPAVHHQTSPDIRVQGQAGEFNVECKRKSRLSDYAREEREQWLRAFSPIRDWLVAQRRQWVLDFVFHVPLMGLPETWLERKVLGRLELAAPGVVVDDEELHLTVREVDLGVVQDELREQGIRMDGSRLPTLLFGEFDPSVGVTSAIRGEFRPDHPNVVDDIEWACGGTWTCDAPAAVDAKARHMKRDLAEAIDQLPEGTPGAVHWGVDVYSGELVKRALYEKTLTALGSFDFGTRSVEWIYAHIFEFFVPVDQNFEVIEDCHFFGREGATTNRLEPCLIIVPEDGAS